jgi:glucose/arabinose dehydrogenase
VLLRRAFPALLAAAAVLAACSDDAPVPTASPTVVLTASPTVEATPGATASPTPAPTVATTPTATPEVTATTPAAFGPIATEAVLGGRAFERPIEVISTGAAGELWVADQRGDIRAYQSDGDQIRVVLDIRERVRRSGNEEGLLSVTLDPQFASNRHLWVYYSAEPGVRRTRLARFEVSEGVAAAASELVVLEVSQPYGNHNGGTVRFGPDGMLYLSLGDGGSGGDPLGNGQNLETLLGSVLRIDVREASKERPYVVPVDNPFVGNADARDEIWAYGLRNPWRMAFDDTTGALWLGDVGQSSAEEIDIIERGANYGWNRFEGFACFDRDRGCDREGLTMPVFNYSHPDFGRGACSVTGGVVYRANRVPQIANAYIFGDFCSGDLWAIAADAPDGAEIIAEGFGGLASFALDADGEVLLLRFNEPILRIVSP